MTIRFQGGTLTVTDGTSETTVRTQILGFTSCSHNPGDADDVDRTNAASTRRRRRGGLKDPGTFEFELQRDPEDPGQMILQEIKGTTNLRQFQWTQKSGVILQFKGYVKKLDLKAETGQDTLGSCTVRISGATQRILS